MCGIAGWVGEFPGGARADAEAVLRQMTDSLRHRGPDDAGLHLDERVGLGHRRLSIIDIDGGHQPMWNAAGTLGIVYNGEIYNFPRLRDELQRDGYRFRTRCDTEVLLALYEAHGDGMLERLNGMFAFALWDAERRRLLAARDRAGEKPLHYVDRPGMFLFASEIKALLRHPAVSREIDGGALARYLAHEYVPAPRSIFRDVRKLPAAHALAIEDGGRLRIWRYWTPEYAGAGASTDETEARQRLAEAFEASVRDRLISDVPLGVFLSGGIDSSAVVAFLVGRAGCRSLSTFSVGFREASFDESAHALRVARHFDTDHHQELLDPARLLETLPEVVERLDEPFADPSVIPTYLLSAFTRQHVTVALGGDGGDELFAGYPTFNAQKVARIYDRAVPRPLHAAVCGVAATLPVSHRNMSFDFLARRFLRGAYCDEPERHSRWLGAFTPEMQRELWRGDPPEPDPAALYDDAHRAFEGTNSDDSRQRALQLYFQLYLQDDILHKVDRASMMHSLEVRCPFLDVDVMRAAQALPASIKHPGFRLKHALKSLLDGLVPEPILRRPKKGFGVPVGRWFRQELRGELTRVLAPKRIAAAGMFEPAYVERLVAEHLSGKQNHRKPLWTLFIFEHWRERWG